MEHQQDKDYQLDLYLKTSKETMCPSEGCEAVCRAKARREKQLQGTRIDELKK